MFPFNYTLWVLLSILLMVTGLGTIHQAQAGGVEIVVKPGTKSFMPQLVKIKAGDSITWINQDEQDHFLTSAGPSTKQVVIGTENLEIHRLLHPGESYRHSFAEPETYFYFCAIHMQMWGTVMVEK